MISRLVKLVTLGLVVQRVARHPAVATPARGIFQRFSKRRAAGRWHHVEPPDGNPLIERACGKGIILRKRGAHQLA